MSPIKVGMKFGTYDTLVKEQNKLYAESYCTVRDRNSLFGGKKIGKSYTHTWKIPKDSRNFYDKPYGVKCLSIKDGYNPHAHLSVIHHSEKGLYMKYYYRGNEQTANGDIIFDEITIENISAKDFNGNGIVDYGEIFDTGD